MGEKEYKINIYLHALLLLICILMIEFLFLFLSLQFFDKYNVIRIVLFSLVTSGAISLICYFLPKRINLIVSSLFLLAVVVYGISQLGLYLYLNTFYNFNSVLSMFGKVNEFAVDFLEFIKPIYFSLLIPLLLYLMFFRFLAQAQSVRYKNNQIILNVFFIIVLHLMSINSLTYWQNEETSISAPDLYKNPVFLEKSLREFGITRFLLKDFEKTFLSFGETKLLISDYNTEVENRLNFSSDLNRQFDDSEWEKLIEAETNSYIKAIDKILINRYISPKNDKTGIFKNKNLIMILVESFDYIAINESITPNLHNLVNNSWLFDNYYTPKSICSTGDSELMSLTSILAIPSECMFDKFVNNKYSMSLFELFNQQDYYTSSYHNYYDKYYDRNIMHPNLGVQHFYDADNLSIDYSDGWPSDLELIEKSYPKFSDKSKFFSFIISVSMHTPYELTEGYVEENWSIFEDEFQNLPLDVQIYLSKSIELDMAIGELFELLESGNQLKDTVIILYADHLPPKIDHNLLMEQTTLVNRFSFNGQYLSPLIIYSSDISPKRISNLGSTVDLLPTIANLFDLSYDPRFYLGSDIFDESIDHFVYFQNGDWISNSGRFINTDSRYETNSGTNSEIDDVSNLNLRYYYYYSLSESILKNNYFQNRRTNFLTK